MRMMLIRRSPSLIAIAMSVVIQATPARAADVLFTFGEMLRLQALPLESAERRLSEEEILLYQNFEFYAYTVFESLQVANDAARLIGQEPLFCAPAADLPFPQGGRHRPARRLRHRRAVRAHQGDRRPLDRYDDEAGERGAAARPARRLPLPRWRPAARAALACREPARSSAPAPTACMT